MRQIAKVGWFGLYLLSLIWYLLNRKVPDADIVTVYASIALAFPLGYVAAGALSSAFVFSFEKIGLLFPGYSQVISVWLITILAGYFQWFVLLPYAIRKLKPKPGTPDA